MLVGPERRKKQELAFFRRNLHPLVAELGLATRPLDIVEIVRRERRPYLAGANPARQLSLQPVAVGAAEGGNDLG